MKTKPTAKVIADSINSEGDRLLTVEATMHRFVLAEFNTHRAFSRNSASSRAIPVSKQLAKIQSDPAMPVEFGTNKTGMQADDPLSGLYADQAAYHWLKARDAAYLATQRLSVDLNVHKQVANRMLEPWMWHTVIFSTTELDNFFEQRCSELAQPEIRVVAEAVRDAVNASTPEQISENGWHMPYLQEDEKNLDIDVKKKISVARCARVSYLTHDGSRSIEKDLELYERLVTAQPPHWSPLEHVATPDLKNKSFVSNGTETFAVPTLGNFVGWRQMRHDICNLQIVNNRDDV